MKYCNNCLMPDTRPGLMFDESGVCSACINYEKQKLNDWGDRWKQLEKLCDRHRGKNGNGYDCAIAVSGGKDSHYQTYILKEKLKMNPVLLTVGNTDWTITGQKNLENLSERFGCDIIQFNPNRQLTRNITKKAFVEIGQPSWYMDMLLYSYPLKMAMNLGVKLIMYGEDVNFTYGGKYNEETPSAMLQTQNGIVEPLWDKWLEDGNISEKDFDSARPPSVDECKKFGLEPTYLSYFVSWNSVHNFEVAKRLGFKHLGHEYQREGSLDNYDQIDSLSYLFNPFLKYPKFGHSISTDNASRWIRYGMCTREEMIPFVERHDGKLDQGVMEKFCEFTGIKNNEFWNILDKWYNPKFFKQDKDGVWHKKFKVGTGLIK
ncbi:MAG: N-acetyl sugar amidotransferase [Thaumarchaeota archaeon]|nr:MAG: N-acetyl sugar amidotransferase [Nitrososphaerota archaeon]